MGRNGGFFITFEGPEGSGKSTQIQLLGQALTARGATCHLTREPGGTHLAEQLRQLVKNYSGDEKITPVAELLLLEAARSQHVTHVILPALERGETVLCDRFTDSTVAYQGAARGLPEDVISKLNALAAAGCRPDLTIILDLPPESGFTRARERRETRGEYDRFEAEDLEFHRKVRQAFLDLARAEPQRVRVVSALGDPLAVHAAILAELEKCGALPEK